MTANSPWFNPEQTFSPEGGGQQGPMFGGVYPDGGGPYTGQAAPFGNVQPPAGAYGENPFGSLPPPAEDPNAGLPPGFGQQVQDWYAGATSADGGYNKVGGYLDQYGDGFNDFADTWLTQNPDSDFARKILGGA